MTDISKCLGTNCKLKDTCFRYLAPADKWQSYCAFDVKYQMQLMSIPNYICDHYWEYKNENKQSH